MNFYEKMNIISGFYAKFWMGIWISTKIVRVDFEIFDFLVFGRNSLTKGAPPPQGHQRLSDPEKSPNSVKFGALFWKWTSSLQNRVAPMRDMFGGQKNVETARFVGEVEIFRHQNAFSVEIPIKP